jgi:hypothetical protein
MLRRAADGQIAGSIFAKLQTSTPGEGNYTKNFVAVVASLAIKIRQIFYRPLF